MKTLSFSVRNTKEILRDKLNLAFGLGFPVVVLLLSLIQSNIPVELFAIDKLAPGIAVFGLSFISLFSGMLIAKDRTSAFMLRLFASPMMARQLRQHLVGARLGGRLRRGDLCRRHACIHKENA